MRFPPALAALLALSAAVGSLGCDKTTQGTPPPGVDSSKRGAPPPPADSAVKSDACKGGGGEVKDPGSSPFFPRKSGGYCVNPDGETKSFGEHAAKPVKDICGLFDGGCDQYLKHNLKRLVSVDYIDGAGTGGTVTAILSHFESADYAYGMFTDRVVGDEDPARTDMPKKTSLQAPSAMGTGSLYAWKGAYLLELSYVNTNESGDQKKLKASADKILPLIGESISSLLPGPPLAPLSVQKLPTEAQIPLGVSYVLGSALGIDGLGAGAIGYYRADDKRYRVIVFAKDDADQAKDTLKSFGKKKGATEEKGVGEAGVRLMAQDDPDGPKAEWILARKGKIVAGVGDESFALKAGASADAHDKVSLSKDDKEKTLRALLDQATK